MLKRIERFEKKIILTIRKLQAILTTNYAVTRFSFACLKISQKQIKITVFFFLKSTSMVI